MGLWAMGHRPSELVEVAVIDGGIAILPPSPGEQGFGDLREPLELVRRDELHVRLVGEPVGPRLPNLVVGAGQYQARRADHEGEDHPVQPISDDQPG